MFETLELLRAYDEIKTCRPINGFGFCSIPFTAIDAWASRNRWNAPAMFEFLRRAVRVIDDFERQIVADATPSTN